MFIYSVLQWFMVKTQGNAVQTRYKLGNVIV